MSDWTDNEDLPPPRWVVYGFTVAGVIALVCILAMALWMAAAFFAPELLP